MFLRMVGDGIRRAVLGPTTILGDNSAMVDLVTHEGASSRSGHFELATIFVKYAVQRLLVIVTFIGTKFMVADIFTKATDEATFRTMRGVMRNDGSEPVGYLSFARRVLAMAMRTRTRR